MKPVFQTKLKHPDGNCTPACIASILELPLEKVPELQIRGNGWYDAYSSLLAENGILICRVSNLEYLKNEYYLVNIVTRHQDGVISAHSVVCYNGEIVHDPHPSNISATLPKHAMNYFSVQKVNK